MRILLKIDPARITLDDLIAIEEAATISARELKKLVGKFLTDEAGNYLPEADAMNEAGKLSYVQLKETVKQFGEGIKKLENSAVPPVNGGN